MRVGVVREGQGQGERVLPHASEDRQVAGLYKSIVKSESLSELPSSFAQITTGQIVPCYSFGSLLDLRKSVSLKMQRGIIAWLTLATVAIVTVMVAVEAVPYERPLYWDQLEDEDPAALMDWFIKIGLIRGRDPENIKRGLDLGLSRGFSGSQAAKHLMGLAAANYAGGPGRRRRSEQA
ncbi:diuretic hormone class 2 [Venturia canescens]|uniref:diuretic hormone class 2 n=1 Tax=Venturia canescens TaxID=32260 RepID=UPI001C9CE304|nr:diuretic hormone class 2 [Venturia canescens]